MLAGWCSGRESRSGIPLVRIREPGRSSLGFPRSATRLAFASRANKAAMLNRATFGRRYSSTGALDCPEHLEKHLAALKNVFRLGGDFFRSLVDGVAWSHSIFDF